MSICVCARVNGKCLDEKLLEKVMVEFFPSKNSFTKEAGKKCVTYVGITDENEITLSFVSEKNPPSNIYDSSIINGEYEFTQLLFFDVNKENATIDTYKMIIEFCKYLKTKIESDILVTSDVHNDICLLKEQEMIWSEDISFI